jgi:hypothetical protein
MKAITAVFAIALFSILPTVAYAACPNITGPYICCGTSWYQYDWPNSCAGTGGSGVSTATLSCYSLGGHQFTGSSGSVSYQHTVQSTDPVTNYNNWQVSAYFDFDDPSNSQYNTLTATVSVTHNGSTTSYTFLNWSGASGDLSCGRYGYYYFTAVVGDTITVTYNATNFNNPNTVIKASTPTLFN